MCNRSVWDQANRCAQSLDSQVPPGGISRLVESITAGTFVTTKEVHVAGEWSAHLSALLPCKRWTGHRPVPCGKQPGMTLEFPFLAPAALRSSPTPCRLSANILTHRPVS